MEAPIPLIDLIAARLSGSDGSHFGTATLIAPAIAVTASTLVENHQEYSLEIFETAPDDGPVSMMSASVIARDDELGFAVLEFEPGLTADLPATLLAAELPKRGSAWTTGYYWFEVFDERSGTVEGTEQVGVQAEGRVFFRNLLKLSQSNSDEYSAAVLGQDRKRKKRDDVTETDSGEAEGGPVIVNNQLVGLMTSRQWEGFSYAIPLSEMMKSPAWKVVETAMQSPAAADTEREPPMPQFRVTPAGLNLRQGPSTGTRVIGELSANSVIEKREESADKNWFLVRAEKNGATIEGWVAARFLKPVGESSTTPSAPDRPPFDRLAFVKRLTNSAASALAHATGMRVAQRHSKIHMEHLIAGLSQKEDGPTRTELRRAGIGQDQLAALVKEAVGTTLPESYTPLLITDELSPLSEHVEQALSAATALADENGSKSIRSRHLLRGAFSVSDCKLIQVLIRRGVDPGKLRLDDEPAPAKRRPAQAGIRSDDLEGNDLLDIENEVETLCTVLASTYVKPPISLGLFGDWGSGKSFFMKKMEARFNQLQEIARNEDSAYCKNIVQLWFNAWHYMDTNLWASLATQIFDELAQQLARQKMIAAGEDPDYERAQLAAQKAKANEEVAKADQEKRAADAKVRASQEQLASLRSGETEVAGDPQAVLREGFRLAVQQPEVRETIKAAESELKEKVAEAAKTLNLKPADSAKAQLLELQGLWGYLRAIVLAVRNTNKTGLVLMLIAFAVTTAAVLWLLPIVLAQNWIQPLWARISSVALVLLATISPFLPAAKRAVQILHEAIRANQESVEKARLETEKSLQSRHQELQLAARSAQQKLEKATKTAQGFAEKLDQLRADGKMSNFIRQRQQSSDYTKYLGVIARARNDFEQLSTLLAKENDPFERQRRAQERAAARARDAGQETETIEPEDLLPPIDRIILYIDDLDRCPEDKVVDVLQAVHLLLAFPLFVVVVGVDPRWLLHSLRQHSKAFQSQTENDEASEEERTRWHSTPLNYLEKIFQIPFTLRPMGETGFGKLIDTLIKPPAERLSANEGLEEAHTSRTEITQQIVTTPKTAATEIVPQPPVDGRVAEEPAAVGTAAARESWTTRFFGFLTRPFGSRQHSGDAKAGAGSSGMPQTAVPPIADTGAGATSEPPPKTTAGEPAKTEQTQTAVNQVAGEPAATQINPRPDHLLINEAEQEFMKQLHELIPSPRATKRFINIYRLIRASVDLDDKLRLEDFNGKDGPGKYRPVLMLLAILTGYPDQATEILRALLERKPSETWWEFIDSFKSRAEKPPAAGNKSAPAVAELELAATKNAISSGEDAATADTKQNGTNDNATLKDTTNLLSEVDAESWRRLLEKLRNLRHLFPAQSCDDFVEWAPKVARYSFQSGRVLLTRGVREPQQKTGVD